MSTSYILETMINHEIIIWFFELHKLVELSKKLDCASQAPNALSSAGLTFGDWTPVSLLCK